MEKIWVVYEWHPGMEMSEEDKGHFTSKRKAVNFLNSIAEFWGDPTIHLKEWVLSEKDFCPVCGKSLENITLD